MAGEVGTRLEELARRFVEAHEQQDVDAILEMVQDDVAVDLMDPEIPPVVGRDALRAYLEEMFAAAREKIEIEELIASGGSVAIRWWTRAEQSKQSFTGEGSAQQRGCTVLHFEGDRVRDILIYSNPLVLLRQS